MFEQSPDRQTLIARDNDMLRVESCLVKYKAVELRGDIGVGKSVFLDYTVAWWKSTRLVEIVISVDIFREGICSAASMGGKIVHRLFHYLQGASLSPPRIWLLFAG